jgi:cyclophilin family peptidyl-prolyl cis-trans isomerase
MQAVLRMGLTALVVLIVTMLAAPLMAQTPAEPSGNQPAAEPARPQAAKPSEQPAPAAQPAGPENARFDALFKDWKALLAQLRSLYEEYRVAEPARQSEIEKQYAELIAKGQEMEPKVVAAAEKAYAEAPGANPQLAEFLLAMLDNQVKLDNYEEALRVAKLLIENRCPDKRIYNWACYASFCLGHYDAAQTYFELAQTNKVSRPLGKEVLDGTVKQFLRDPDKFKQNWEKEQQIREAEAKADDLPRVLLKTSKGDITLELFENEAPNTVANFISLVEKGFYKGIVFHRVMDGFMAQGGCPNGNGSGGPGYTIPDEVNTPNFRKHFRGSLSMAKTAAPDSGGSQFFLTFVPTTHLDGLHTVFGRVIDGIDVLAKLRRVQPGKEGQPEPDKILEAKVLRKREHPYTPKTVEE